MKYLTLTVLIATAAIGLLFAQGKISPGGNTWQRFRSPYDPKTPPPLTVSEAHVLALAYLGPATNRFYCVSATCLELGKSGFPAWKFGLSATNGESAYLEFTFDKVVYPDPRTGVLLRDK